MKLGHVEPNYTLTCKRQYHHLQIQVKVTFNVKIEFNLKPLLTQNLPLLHLHSNHFFSL